MILIDNRAYCLYSSFHVSIFCLFKINFVLHFSRTIEARHFIFSI